MDKLGLHYQVKRYKSSKSIRIHVKGSGAILVTAPTSTPLSVIESFLESHGSWLEDKVNDSPITNIGTYSVEIVKSDRPFVTINNSTKSIIVRETDVSKISSSNKDYIQEYFKNKLNKTVPEIMSRALEIGIEYSSISLRANTSRWGSRSSTGTISLNIWLASLPDELLWYVVHHEFAHTFHMNHSRDFWTKLESMYPGSYLYKKEIKQYSVPYFK